MRILRALVIIIAAMAPPIAPPTQAGWPGWGRYWGHGWGDGYHSGKTPPPHARHNHHGRSAPYWAILSSDPFPLSQPDSTSDPQARHSRPAGASRGSSLFRRAGEGSSVLASGHAAASL